MVRESWVPVFRPASYDPTVLIGEKKTIFTPIPPQPNRSIVRVEDGLYLLDG